MAGVSPSAVQVATTQNFVSADFLFVHEPAVRKQLIMRYLNDSLLGFLELTSSKEAVTQKDYEHHIKDSHHEYFTVDGSTATGVPGAAITVTVLTGYDTSTVYSLPRVGFRVMTSGGILMKITAKNTAVPGAHTITLAPVKSTDAVPSTNPLTLIIVDSMWGEKTGQPEGLTPRAAQYTNNTQIIKESYEYSGSERTNKVWYQISDANYGSGYVWTYAGEYDTFKRFLDYCEATMLVSEKTTNTGVITDGSYSTEGLFPFIRNGGNIINWTALTGFDLADFDTAVKLLNSNRAGNEFAFYQGIDLYMQVNDGIKDMFPNGAVTYGAFNGDKELAINMGFSSINRIGYTFHLSRWDALSHPRVFGAPGYNYPGLGVMVPLDKVKTADGTMTGHIKIRYKELEGYSREFERWETGAANGTFTNETDGIRVNYRTERGFEGFNPEHFVIVERV